VGDPLVLCRPALPSDRAAVLHFLKRIWDGQDYVPQVWDHWLREPRSLLATAVLSGRAVGMGRLSDLGWGEWWLEGLRVSPKLQGRGIGSAMHDYLVGAWERTGADILRLTTHRSREPVRRMCLRTGFVPTHRLTGFRAPPASGDDAFREWKGTQGGSASAGAVAVGGDWIDLGWRFARLRDERWAEQAERGNLWEWRGGRGWLILCPAWEAESALSIAAAGLQPEDGPALLSDARRLCLRLGQAEVHWLAPDETWLRRALRQAGFRERPDERLIMFERRR
jgi:GNAT superfamily N-acetyltransferase